MLKRRARSTSNTTRHETEWANRQRIEKSGDPGWIRTSDPQLRRLMLYPAELRGRHLTVYLCRTDDAMTGKKHF